MSSFPSPDLPQSSPTQPFLQQPQPPSSLWQVVLEPLCYVGPRDGAGLDLLVAFTLRAPSCWMGVGESTHVQVHRHGDGSVHLHMAKDGRGPYK